MSSGPRRDHTGPGSAPATASRDDPARTPDDAALREAVEAVSEAGPGRGLLDDDLPSAPDPPSAPRTLPHAMAAPARQLGLQLPKPRLRGMLHLFAFPATMVAGLVLVALGESLARSEEHTSELQSRGHLVCRLLLENKNKSSHST